MEQELEWRKSDVAEAEKTLEREKEDLNARYEELEKDEEELDDREVDIEARESKLLLDRENFTTAQKDIMEKILVAQNKKGVAPELSKMSLELGIDMDKIKEQQKSLAVDRKNYEARLSSNCSRRASRRPSQPISARMSRRNSNASDVSYQNHRDIEKKAKHLRNKMAVREFLNSLYTDASNQKLMTELDHKHGQLQKRDEEFSLTTKLLEQAKSDLKNMKKEVAIKDK